ncbi:MAG TPA: ceramidase domain-containing protein, partial [Chitinophagales bacterium]|nr:ceramidase domain-containing protein [Chitinophagales bacterium]
MVLSARIKWKLLKTRLYFERLHARMFYLPIIIFLLSTLALTLYYHLFQFTDLWAHWSEANGNAFHFCEMNRMDELIRQPANTWSNLGFFLVGLFTLTLGIHDLKYSERKKSDNFLVRYPIFSIMFGASAIYLFIGSFFFHASLSGFFQKLDQAGMYAVVVMVLVFNLYKIFPIIRVKGQYKSSHALMVAFGVALNYLLYTSIYKVNINILFPALVLIVFLTSCYYLLFVSREHYFTNYLWAGTTILLLSAVVWILDRTNTVCNPESIFQGHALWHI